MPEKIIYDLGCSTNKTLPEAIGVDIREGVTDYHSDIHELEFFGDETGDVIISRHSYEHLLDPTKALKEWIRILKPGGKIIFVLPDHEFINTIDPYYSAGQHLHAYTRESFKNFLSLFEELSVSKTETVLKDWSFGCVAYKLPRVSILIPHIEGTREAGLKACLDSIDALNYPRNLIETIVIPGEGTVPQKIDEGLKKATGDVIVYGANDMTFESNCLRIAVTDMLELGKGLVSFNEGPLLEDLGNICTHFALHKDLLPFLENSQIFSTDFIHASCDNFLYCQAFKLNQFHYCSDAKITHNHFSKGAQMDATYEKGWSHVEQDRETLRKKLLTLEGK